MIRIKVPTSRTQKGPRLVQTREQLVVDYDFEEDDGTVVWARLVFQVILAFEYRDSSCIHAEDVLPSDDVRSTKQSNYLTETVDLWFDAVGKHAWQQSRGGRDRFKHFTVFFDNACSINIIAASCETAPNNDIEAVL